MTLTQYNTLMRDAMLKAAIRSNILNDGHEGIIKRVAYTTSGIIHDVKGWSAKLSYRTHAALVAQGIM